MMSWLIDVLKRLIASSELTIKDGSHLCSPDDRLGLFTERELVTSLAHVYCTVKNALSFSHTPTHTHRGE